MINPAVNITSPGQLELCDLGQPAVPPGQVLIRGRYSLISTGTELTCASGDFPKDSVWDRWTQYPVLVAGNEVVEMINMFVGQVMLLHEFDFSLLTDEQTARWRRWHKEWYDLDPADAEMRGAGDALFVSIGAVSGALRDDLGERFISTDDNTCQTRDVIDELVTLRGVGEVMLDEDEAIASEAPA